MMLWVCPIGSGLCFSPHGALQHCLCGGLHACEDLCPATWTTRSALQAARTSTSSTSPSATPTRSGLSQQALQLILCAPAPAPGGTTATADSWHGAAGAGAASISFLVIGPVFQVISLPMLLQQFFHAL